MTISSGEGTTPGSPTGLMASVLGSTVSLSWTAPTTGGPPSAYIIEAGSHSGLSDLARFSTGNTATSYWAYGVGNGTYYIRVSATNGWTSGPSNEVAVFVGPAPPGAPTGLTVSVSGSNITLAWKAPRSGGVPTTYVLEAGSAPGLTNVASLSTGSTATAWSSGGVGSGVYYVRVRAGNACGKSAASNEVVLVVR